MPHVLVKKEHPLALYRYLSYEELKNFPFVSYEQGKHGDTIFAEEIMEEPDVSKHIEINDRASLMNVLLTTECYTIGTGIMPSTLNSGKIIGIPLKSDIYYNIGYILNIDRRLLGLTKKFIKMLSESVKAAV